MAVTARTARRAKPTRLVKKAWPQRPKPQTRCKPPLRCRTTLCPRSPRLWRKSHRSASQRLPLHQHLWLPHQHRHLWLPQLQHLRLWQHPPRLRLPR